MVNPINFDEAQNFFRRQQYEGIARQVTLSRFAKLNF
jgi:hypothetical protein